MEELCLHRWKCSILFCTWDPFPFVVFVQGGSGKCTLWICFTFFQCILDIVFYKLKEERLSSGRGERWLQKTLSDVSSSCSNQLSVKTTSIPKYCNLPYSCVNLQSWFPNSFGSLICQKRGPVEKKCPKFCFMNQMQSFCAFTSFFVSFGELDS